MLRMKSLAIGTQLRISVWNTDCRAALSAAALRIALGEL